MTDKQSLVRLLDLEASDSALQQGISCILQRTVEASDHNGLRLAARAPSPAFTGAHIPDITIATYAARLHKYFKCSAACWVAMLVYMDRVLSGTRDSDSPVVLDTLSVHRLLLSALVVSVKFHEDSQYSNQYYAQVGGFSLQEMNRMEVDFVGLLSWDLEISGITFDKYFEQLTIHPGLCVACQHALKCARHSPAQPSIEVGRSAASIGGGDSTPTTKDCDMSSIHIGDDHARQANVPGVRSGTAARVAVAC